jgi:hypothetical protein
LAATQNGLSCMKKKKKKKKKERRLKFDINCVLFCNMNYSILLNTSFSGLSVTGDELSNLIPKN